METITLQEIKNRHILCAEKTFITSAKFLAMTGMEPEKIYELFLKEIKETPLRDSEPTKEKIIVNAHKGFVGLINHVTLWGIDPFSFLKDMTSVLKKTKKTRFKPCPEEIKEYKNSLH